MAVIYKVAVSGSIRKAVSLIGLASERNCLFRFGVDMVLKFSVACLEMLTVGQHISQVRFQVLKAGSMKMTVFWVVAPCSLVEVYQRFRGACCLNHQSDDEGI
jgi:hypothetical protein